MPNITEITLDKIDLFKVGDYGAALPIIKPFFYCHRINTSNELSNFEDNCGIELDLRDKNENLILQHDPFKDGENFEEYLKNFNKQSIILNIKSERIEFKVLKLLEKHQINNYFFLDSSFPMIYQLNKSNNQNIAVRYSEYEPIENIIKLKNMVKWVWVDCFNKFPLDVESYEKIKNANLKICLVSPELQNYKDPKKEIDNIRKIICENNFEIDAICTKSYMINEWAL